MHEDLDDVSRREYLQPGYSLSVAIVFLREEEKHKYVLDSESFSKLRNIYIFRTFSNRSSHPACFSVEYLCNFRQNEYHQPVWAKEMAEIQVLKSGFQATNAAITVT